MLHIVLSLKMGNDTWWVFLDFEIFTTHLCFLIYLLSNLCKDKESSFDKVLKDTAGMPCLPTDMTSICVDTPGPNRGRIY